jgi:hypothetical protein
MGTRQTRGQREQGDKANKGTKGTGVQGRQANKANKATASGRPADSGKVLCVLLLGRIFPDGHAGPGCEQKLYHRFISIDLPRLLHSSFLLRQKIAPPKRGCALMGQRHNFKYGAGLVNTLSSARSEPAGAPCIQRAVLDGRFAFKHNADQIPEKPDDLKAVLVALAIDFNSMCTEVHRFTIDHR